MLGDNRYNRGILAEDKICKDLVYEIHNLNMLQLKEFSIIRDVSYKGYSNKFAQIDAVLVCEYGIFCLELKSWNTEIEVSTARMWKLREGREYPNPVIQNGRHTLVLQTLITNQFQEIPKLHVHNIVLFDNITTIRNTLNQGLEQCKVYPNVMNASSFIGYLNNTFTNKLLSVNQCRKISRYLQYLANKNNPLFKTQQSAIAGSKW